MYHMHHVALLYTSNVSSAKILSVWRNDILAFNNINAYNRCEVEGSS